MDEMSFELEPLVMRVTTCLTPGCIDYQNPRRWMCVQTVICGACGEQCSVQEAS